MSISGLGDEESQRRVQLAAGPPLIWLTAFLSHALATGLNLKQKVDQIASDGHLGPAASQYYLLRTFMEWSPVDAHEALSSSTRPTTPEIQFYVKRLLELKVDLILSLVDTELRLGQIAAADAHSHSILAHTSSLHPKQMVCAFNLKTQACALSSSPPSARDLDIFIDRSKWLLPLFSNERMKHDLAVYEAFRSTLGAPVDTLPTGAPAQPSAELNKLSVFTFPFQPYNHQGLLDPSRPVSAENLVQWQDVNHLASLDEQQKEYIRSFQAGRGLPVSDLE